MERFISALERSLATGNWYAAVALALTIPDICGWLEVPTLGSQKRYQGWFDKYLLHCYKDEFFGPDFSFLSGADCYALRCAFLHEGTDDILRQRAREVLARVRFSTTGSHCIRADDVLVLNVQAFCSQVCRGAKDWLEDVGGNAEVASRMGELIEIHTEGFSLGPGLFVER